MSESMMQELSLEKKEDLWKIYMNKRFLLPDWGLLEANNDADIDCNGIDEGFRGIWDEMEGVVGGCSIGASKRWICKM